MVELRPSALKLVSSKSCPGPETFVDLTDHLSLRYVDLFTKGSESSREWLNTEDAVAFELRQPSHSQLAELVCVIGRLRPKEIDYMHACGDHCIVYWMRW